MANTKLKIIFLLVAALGTFGMVKNSQAATINAASCEHIDVQMAIDAAASGDTVSVPTGSCVWNSSLMITKSVRLHGENASNTIILNGGSGYILEIVPAVPADNPLVEISDLTFDANGSGSGLFIKNENKDYDFSNFRIHHNIIKNAIPNLNGIYTRGMVFGLIDNNHFINNFYDLNIRGYDWYSWDKYSKVEDNTLGYNSLGMGGSRFLYVESNVFEKTDRMIVASGEGARWVVRYNTLNEVSLPLEFDIHGDTQNDGNVAVEIYENIRTNLAADPAYSSSPLVDYRGGTAMIYNNNVFVNPSGVRAQIKIREETSPCSALRQGYDMRIHNGYIWNNRNSVNDDLVYLIHHGPTADYDQGNCLEAGVDYWSDTSDDSNASSQYFHIGIAADRPVGCSSVIPAEVYWETDTKKLYRCEENNWVFIYEPYAYPHPLRNGGLTDAIPPAAPNTLTVY